MRPKLSRWSDGSWRSRRHSPPAWLLPARRIDRAVQLSYQQAEAIVKAVFMGGGFTPHEAQVCTAEILDAEWRGKSSYGLELVPPVLDWRAEKLGEPEVREEGPAAAVVGESNGV